MHATASDIPLTHAAPTVRTQLRHLMRGVAIEAVRRNEIYVAMILLGLYALGGGVVRLIGIESAATARFVANLGLELGLLLSSLLVILVGARQIPDEIDARTIYPVLAKPVSRGTLLLGKALPTWLTGVASLAIFVAVTLIVTPRLAAQSGVMLAQAIWLGAVLLAMLTSMAFCASLHMPTAVAVLVVIAVHWGGPPLLNVLTSAMGAGPAVRACLGVIPDAGALGLFDRFVNGGAPLGLGALALMTVYGLGWSALLGWAAWGRLRSMPL